MKLFSRDAPKVNVIAMTYKVREEVNININVYYA